MLKLYWSGYFAVPALALTALSGCADKPEVVPTPQTDYPICTELGQTDCIPEAEPWPDGKPK